MGSRGFDIAIVGAGFAGAATAYHLSRGFAGSIALLEQEKAPGAHASGRNASMLRQTEADPAIRAVAMASRGPYEELADEVGYRPVGSLLLGRRATLETVRVPEAPGSPERSASRFVAPDRAFERIPLLVGHSFEAVLETPTDGVLDTWALLSHYLAGARSRGVELLTEHRVLELRRGGGGGAWRLRTARGEIEAGRVVDAAGGWAGEVAALAGVPGPELVAYKRHLFVVEGVGPIDPDWPFVWDLDRHFYLRPESEVSSSRSATRRPRGASRRR